MTDELPPPPPPLQYEAPPAPLHPADAFAVCSALMLEAGFVASEQHRALSALVAALDANGSAESGSPRAWFTPATLGAIDRARAVGAMTAPAARDASDLDVAARQVARLGLPVQVSDGDHDAYVQLLTLTSDMLTPWTIHGRRHSTGPSEPERDYVTAAPQPLQLVQRWARLVGQLGATLRASADPDTAPAAPSPAPNDGEWGARERARVAQLEALGAPELARRLADVEDRLRFAEYELGRNVPAAADRAGAGAPQYDGGDW